MQITTKMISEFIRNESGASAAEYALILVLIGAGVTGASLFLGGAVSTAINTAAACFGSNGGIC